MTKDNLMDMFYKMYLTRLFEIETQKHHKIGNIYGTYHLCIGEEATNVGAVFAMKKQDYLYNTHRGHGQAIAFGMDINSMMAEMFGKETGCCKGRGGSMHMADIKNRYMGSNGIVGGNIPVSAGSALAIKMKKIDDTVVFTFFGDGATNEGAFHETLNMAQIYKLPIVFVCINNEYGVSTHICNSSCEPNLTKRAKGYNIYSLTADGNDVNDVNEKVKLAREFAVNNGPAFVECKTYRTCGHSKSDKDVYRTKEEIQAWEKKCPIKRFEKYLVTNNLISQKEVQDIKQKAEEIIKNSIKFAMKSKYPSLCDTVDDVYA